MIEKTSFDIVVFLGDYVDSHLDSYTPNLQLQNLEEVLAYKNEHPENTILLLGNHDIHYLPWVYSKYSGYQVTIAPKFNNLFTQAIEARQVQMCFQSGSLLFTHAGVTRTWCDNHHIDQTNPMNDINDLLYANPEALGFISDYSFGYPDPTGNNIFQSPAWVRPDSLLKDAIEGFWQIAGHTQQPNVSVRARGDDKFFFCDTLLHSKEYLTFSGQTHFEIHPA